MSVILGILKAISAIPQLVSIFDEFAAWYVSKRLASMEAEDADAIKKAVTDHDQRPIEHAIGSTVEGLPSGDPGTTLVDSPPGGLP